MYAAQPPPPAMVMIINVYVYLAALSAPWMWECVGG